MQFSQSRLLRAVCLLFAFALTVSASPVLNKPATLQCSARNIAIVRRTVLDEAYFCKWWLSDIRTRSPFLEFTPEQVTKLCKCVAATPSKPKREATVPLLEKRQTKASCSAEVSIRFTQPWRFCNFYSAYYVVLENIIFDKTQINFYSEHIVSQDFDSQDIVVHQEDVIDSEVV
ncbi:hypothetical protein D6C95_08976 [Aureobasidium pullulans]|nr:hypothetical protein D6C95_08976 [Aureobasidium pullulans]